MKLKITKRAVLIGINILCISAVTALSCIGNKLALSQDYNYGAQRWNSEDGHSQVSCFFPDSPGFELSSVAEIRKNLLNNLRTVSIAPEEGKRLCPDAYSAELGKADVSSDINGYAPAEVTAVGGDFFLMRNFTLLDGAYFTDSDVMQDGAVIDRSLAWSLYGSEDIAGMNIKIGGLQFRISAVIDTPHTKEEKKCRGDFPQLYVTYEGASAISNMMGQGDFTKVSCYEAIMPEPVTSYAYNTISGITSQWQADTVENNGRFEWGRTLGKIKTLHERELKTKAVKYPWWENASLMVESKLSFIYLWRIIFMIPPAVTLVWLAVKGARLAKKYIIKGVKLVLDLIEKRKMKKWREKNEQKEI
ncbi:MAG: ABC transporter permease [Ruminococcus sp.]|nr:ABC transporter permease [Ruminococcus sp.]